VLPFLFFLLAPPGVPPDDMTPSISLLQNPLASTSSLYVVATPLGNMNDIGVRALSVLAAVDVVAAEDTRHSQRLLDAFGITTRMLAVHQHNEQEAAGRLIALLESGQQVALITDAGTPAVSDPGAKLVARVRAAGHPVVPVPGPCAAVAALSVSGFAEGGFRFVGFLPPKSAARVAALQALCDEQDTMVFYEAPHRIVECVADMAAVFGGERELLIAREITKLHEQIVRMPLGETTEWFAGDPNRGRGEFVLVLGGAPVVQGLDAETERILGLLLEALPLKGAAKLAAEITGAPKNLLYARALELREPR
jgi:16S rRNA (cytidine1402-2'-O)-methyltransferase